MVSDGLSMINVDMSTTSFSIRKAKIGDRNYLGNNIHYPAGGRTGATATAATEILDAGNTSCAVPHTTFSEAFDGVTPPDLPAG